MLLVGHVILVNKSSLIRNSERAPDPKNKKRVYKLVTP